MGDEELNRNPAEQAQGTEDSAAGRTEVHSGEESGGMSIEDAFAEIKALLAEMDRDDVTLEKSFEDYERGMKLIRYCNSRIDRVEKKVQQMNADGSVSDFTV